MGWPIHRPTGLTHHNPARSSKGYTLVCGTNSNDAVLIDMQGRVVHRWRIDDRRFFTVELLPNGNLLALVAPEHPPAPRTSGSESRFAVDPGGPPEIFNMLGGRGNGLRELDWDGNIVWEHVDSGQHHDFRRLDNGNTIYAGWRLLTDEQAARVRAFDPWPAAFTSIGEEPLRILRAEALADANAEPHRSAPAPGTVIRAGASGIEVQAGSGRLRLLRLQRPGKRPMDAREFLNGRRLDPGQRLGEGTGRGRSPE